MGEIRVKARLTNAVDEGLASSGRLASEEIRSVLVDAVVDTGAVSSIIPVHVADRLGLISRRRRIAPLADGRNEVVPVTGPIIFEVLDRDTIEEAMILGDEVLLGQTALEKLDLLADCANRRLIPNPEHPDQPVLKVRRRKLLW